MKFTNLSITAALAGMLLPAAATAMSAERVSISRAVTYSDLDLSREADRVRLDARIAGAIRQVCGSAQSRDLRLIGDLNRCRRQAKSFALRGRDVAIAAATARRNGVAMVSDVTPKLGQ